MENLRYISFYFTKTASFLLRFLLWWPLNVRYYSIHRICLALEQRNLLFGNWAVKGTEILLMEMSAGFGNPRTFCAGYFKERKPWFKKEYFQDSMFVGNADRLLYRYPIKFASHCLFCSAIMMRSHVMSRLSFWELITSHNENHRRKSQNGLLSRVDGF